MSYNTKIIRKNTSKIKFKFQDGILYVTAPKNIKESYIEKVILKNNDWILNAIKKDMEFKVYKLLSDVSVNEVIYLGKRYKIVSKLGPLEKIYIENGLLYVTYNNSLNKAILDWYKEMATNIFEELCAKWENILGLNANTIRIKLMKTRWGSCNSTKKYINLNLELIRKDIEFINYVILHEYAHIVHNNHSKEFYKFIERYMENYKDVVKAQG